MKYTCYVSRNCTNRKRINACSTERRWPWYMSW